jgi:hypothetical protein
MAGQKVDFRLSTPEDNIQNSKGYLIIGMPFVEIIENGNVEPGDEWGLFRLTDEGLSWYSIGAEIAAGIMEIRIRGQRAVEEISRFGSKEEAVQAKKNLPDEERSRTLIRSVRPK